VLSIAGARADLLHAESSSSFEREVMRRLAKALPHRGKSLDSAAADAIGHSMPDAALVLVTTRDTRFAAPRSWTAGEQRARLRILERMVTVRADRSEIRDLIELEIETAKPHRPAALKASRRNSSA
jgi:hypothetical protein